MSWGGSDIPPRCSRSATRIQVRCSVSTGQQWVSLGLKHLSTIPGHGRKPAIRSAPRLRERCQPDRLRRVRQRSRGVEGVIMFPKSPGQEFATFKFSRGDEVEAVVSASIREQADFVGMKQLESNPGTSSRWNTRSDHIAGKIKNITDFGIFIGRRGIDDWSTFRIFVDQRVKHIEIFAKPGSPAIVLKHRQGNERFSLGIKQLIRPWRASATLSSGHVVPVDNQRHDFGLFFETRRRNQGWVHVSEISKEKIMSLSASSSRRPHHRKVINIYPKE